MYDHLPSIKEGFPPWEPSPDATLLETFDFHDMPLSGVFKENGSRFLFTCLEGHLAEWSLWVYVEADPEEVVKLAAAPQVVDFDVRFAKAFHSERPVAAALSEEGYGIIHSTGLGLVGPGDLAQEALKKLPVSESEIAKLDIGAS